MKKYNVNHGNRTYLWIPKLLLVQVTGGTSTTVKMARAGWAKNVFPTLRTSRFNVCCAVFPSPFYLHSLNFDK